MISMLVACLLSQSPDAGHGVVPKDWFPSNGVLYTTGAAERLFDGADGGVVDELAGYACRTTTPAGFPLAHTGVRSPELSWSVSGHQTIYVPVKLKKPVKVSVWKNMAANKDVVEEVALGIMTLGISTLRLRPKQVAVLTVPLNGKPAKAAGFQAVCRAVSAAAVTAEAGILKPCDDLRCLNHHAALLGPEHPDVLDRAQAIVDEEYARAEDWRSRVDGEPLRSFELRFSRGKDLKVKLFAGNLTPVPLKLPAFEGLDARGRAVHVNVDRWHEKVEPGKSLSVTVRVQPWMNDEKLYVAWPVVVRTNDDRWVQNVPGKFTEGDTDYDVYGEPKCEGGNTSRAATFFRRKRSASDPDTAWRSDGESTHLTLPFWLKDNELYTGELTVWSEREKCPHLTAISGRVAGYKYLLIP